MNFGAKGVDGERATAHSVRMRTLLVVAALLAAPCLVAQTPRDERWRADLDFLVTTLQARHPNLYTRVPAAQWDEAVAGLRERIPGMTDTQVAMELARITAFAGDAHTLLNLRSSALFTSLPLRVQWFNEGWVVTGMPADQPGLIGTVLAQMDNTAMAEVVEKLRPYVSYENEWWFRAQAPNYLISPEILVNLGVQLNRNALTLNGEALVPAVAPAGITAGPILAQPKFPLWARYGGVAYWFTYLPESRTLYFKYNSCVEMPVMPAARFREEMAAAFGAHAVERFVVDVRNNGGGDSRVLGRLLPVVPEGVKRVVITGRQTFSSGLSAVADLMRAGYVSVGEPTGGRPSGFGEVLGFTLPNSGLRGQYSTRAFRGTVQADRETLTPDVVVPWTWGEASQELDPFLEAALAVN